MRIETRGAHDHDLVDAGVAVTEGRANKFIAILQRQATKVPI
jgi:hypothetical protein